MKKREEELDIFERNFMGPEYKGKLGKFSQLLKKILTYDETLCY